MFFSRPIQWYHSHADPIWPDGTFNELYADLAAGVPLLSAKCFGQHRPARPPQGYSIKKAS